MFTLIVITGSTGSGKTDVAVSVAKELGCDIISADSRQIYRGIPVITAAPSQSQLEAVRHHFVGCLDLSEYYSAACFESDVLALIGRLKARGDRYAVMCGGSMMYVDAVVRGLDDLPAISDDVRCDVLELYNNGGLEALREELRVSDPEYLAVADVNNHRRLIHAVEIIRQSGCKFSSLRSGVVRERSFRTLKYAVDMPREELFARINWRVEAMVAAGMEEEARSVYHLRGLNSLNTVGFKEMFAYFDGEMDRDTAIARMAKNTRVYAKKQLTWLRRDQSVRWVTHASDILPAVMRDLHE